MGGSTATELKAEDYLRGILTAKVYQVARETPVQEARGLSQDLGNRVLVKREDLQPIFSFKCRGAANWLAHKGGSAPVIAASAGNHAQGVALAASVHGVPARLVMPKGSQKVKVQAVRARGAEVILHGENYDEAEAYAHKLAKETGARLISPFDDHLVIFGQGTIAMELLKQYQEDIHAIFVPIGGGGLIAGIASYCKAVRPEIRIIGVEPHNANGAAVAKEAGKPVPLERVGLFVDGVAVKQVGSVTWPAIRDYCDEIITATTDEICAAVRDLFDDLRVIAEPAGALATAGMRNYVERTGIQGETLIPILSGANTDFMRLWHIVERSEIGRGNERLMAVRIPEHTGAFTAFCQALGAADISEFNYRRHSDDVAWLFVGLRGDHSSLEELCGNLRQDGYEVHDLTDDEIAKSHMRYLVGGRHPDGDQAQERLFAFTFLSRGNALRHFLEMLGDAWNISLFHYRNHGSAYCRVLAGFDGSPPSLEELQERLAGQDVDCTEQTENFALRTWLR